MKKQLLTFLAILISGVISAQVGIGTTTPTQALDIETNEAGGTAIDINNTGTGDPKINLQLNGTTTFSIGVDNDDADKLKIGTSAPETNTRVTIDNTGNVGIGTTSPDTKLEVQNGDLKVTDDAGEVMLFQGGSIEIARAYSGGAAAFIDFKDDISDDNDCRIYQHNANGLAFTVGGNGSSINAIYIESDGDVGIGTTSPSYKLDVDGEITSRNSNAFRMRQSNYSTFWRNDNTQTLLLITANGDPDGLWNSLRPLTIKHDNGALEIGGTTMFVQNNGNVGIGTTSPNQKLSVNGNASKVGGGSWATFSDRRLKKNIYEFSDGLDKLMQIKPVSFQYNGMAGYTNDSASYIGVIAQDVEKVAPYMIEHVQKKLNESDSVTTDLLMYDGSALTYILVNAVKEQQAIINAQKAEIDVLKENTLKIAELENKINAMILLLNNKEELTVKQD